jgi:hypothetical protein
MRLGDDVVTLIRLFIDCVPWLRPCFSLLVSIEVVDIRSRSIKSLYLRQLSLPLPYLNPISFHSQICHAK